MAFFLGVDAGGTKAEFVLGDDRRELGRAVTGTIQRMRTDAASAEANLQDALRSLTAATGASMLAVRRCCIGTSGNTVEMVVNWLRQAFGRCVGGELTVAGDVDIALDSAFKGRRGVLVLAGTGSNVAGRAADGTIVTAGGWGPVMADQGSGNFLGREGLRHGFLAIDQQRPSRLLDAAKSHWNLTSMSDLIEHANANPAPNYSELAPLVAECAAQGDIVAQEVLQQGGADLAYLAGLVIERIRSLEADVEASPEAITERPFAPPPVAVAGSILAHVAPVRRALERSLRERYAAIEFQPDPADPPLGALWRARQATAEAP